VSETETKTLTVTQEDINADGLGARDCPFALAARRLFPGWSSVTVISHDIHLTNGTGKFESWDLDAEGTAAIRRYDTAREMEPGSYTLTLGRRGKVTLGVGREEQQ
jgi:hypothetical protein